MKFLKILVLSLILLSSINIVSCASWDFYTEIKGINYVGGEEILVVDYANIDANDIYRVYSFNPYTSSSSLRLYNCPTDIDCVTELSNGHLILFFHNGEVWEIKQEYGLFDWSNRTVGTDCTLLADISTP